MNSFEIVTSGVSEYTWGLLVDWLIFAGIYLSLGIDLIPIRALPVALKDIISSLCWQFSREEGELSPMMNMVVNCGAIVGMGNLTLTAVAIIFAGPGVVIWSTIASLVGFGTRFAESFLTVHFRRRNELGEWVGGPMYYLSEVMPKGLAWMGGFFAFFALLAALFSGAIVQSRYITDCIDQLTPVPPPVSAALIAATIAYVIFGGLRRISRFSLFLIPWAIIANIVICLTAIILHLEDVPAAIQLIFNEALSPEAIFGGSVVFVMDYGIKAGVFGNTAGLGQIPILQASAAPGDPYYQGYVSVVVLLVDLVLGLLTSIIVVMSGVYQSFQDTSLAVSVAFNWGLAGSGLWLVPIGLAYALTTMASMSFVGERCFDYLFGVVRRPLFKILWVVSIIAALFIPFNLMRSLYNLISAFVCLPNIMGLIILSSMFFPLVRQSFVDGKPFECPSRTFDS